MQDTKVVRTDFATAINQIANERKIPVEAIFDAIKLALVSAFRKQFGPLPEDIHYYATLRRIW
jgi:hypothetical protein